VLLLECERKKAFCVIYCAVLFFYVVFPMSQSTKFIALQLFAAIACVFIPPPLFIVVAKKEGTHSTMKSDEGAVVNLDIFLFLNRMRPSLNVEKKKNDQKYCSCRNEMTTHKLTNLNLFPNVKNQTLTLRVGSSLF
jgi:hypothetical protein